MIYTTHSSVIAKLFPQNPENAGKRDCTLLSPAAPYERPIALNILPLLNYYPSTKEPAKITCSPTQHLLQTSPGTHCLQALNT